MKNAMNWQLKMKRYEKGIKNAQLMILSYENSTAHSNLKLDMSPSLVCQILVYQILPNYIEAKLCYRAEFECTDAFQHVFIHAERVVEGRREPHMGL